MVISNGHQTYERTDYATRFKPGKSGHPAGRPKGSRNKLDEQMLAVFCEDFERHGAETIRILRESSPYDYLRIAIALLPKQVAVNAAVENVMYVISDRPLSPDEWVAEYCK